MQSSPMRGSALSGTGNLRRLMVMRWFAVGGLLAAIAAAQPLLDIALPLAPMLAAIALLAAFNLATLARLRRPAPVTDTGLFFQLCVDITVLTILLFFSGGGANPFVSLYLPPIAIAAAILPGYFAWAIACISVAAYSLLSFVHVPLEFPDAEHAARLHLSGMWLIFVVSAALITWFVARMTAAIRSRDLALATAREEALRNERIVALGSLAAGAAHELGTPLATIAVIAGEMTRQPGVAGDIKENLALLREQVDHCKSIITGLVERSGQTRAEGGRALPLDHWLEEIVAHWRRLRPHAEPHLALRGAGAAPQIVGEATLEQALFNVFNNAADASPAEVEIEARWDDTGLYLEVRDRGPGIDARVPLRAGRAFVTTRQDGAGIGLFLAHAAIERFGGCITLCNREDGGAITRIELPLKRILAQPE